MKGGAKRIDVTVTPMTESEFRAFYEDVRELAFKHNIPAPIVLLFHIGQMAQTMVNDEVETCGVPYVDSVVRHIDAFTRGLGIEASYNKPDDTDDERKH